MIGGVTRQGGQPAQPDRVTLSAGVKFCHVTFQGGVTRLAGVGLVIHQIHFGGGLTSLLIEIIESHSAEGCSKSSK